MRKSKNFRPAVNDKLEDRTVPSGFGQFGQFQTLLGGAFGGRDGGRFERGDGGGSGERGGRDSGGERGGGISATSSTLNQDARLVQQAFTAFQSSYLKAVAALRLTATPSTGPTQPGLDNFHTAIASAITKLNTAIAKDLANLKNTGTTLNSTIDGFTADLAAELDSAAAGLENSTNSAVLSLNQEARMDIRSALQQAKSEILNDTATGALDSTALAMYRQDVQDAYQTFNDAISNAEQVAISSGNKLDSTAVSDAVTALQTALTTAAETDLGTTFSTSTFNPTTTITAGLTALTTRLTAIAAPTAGNNASARLFTRAVSSAIRQEESLISRAITTAIQNYDNSLL